MMVEHPSGSQFWCDECATTPMWSTTPPTEPGWYWTLWDEKLDTVKTDGKHRPETWHGKPVMWYPVRISEPSR